MIRPEVEAEIVRLHSIEKWPVGTIARELRVHHSVVTRVISQDGTPRRKAERPSLADPYLPFITEMLEKYPRITASRIYHMVKERGYEGRPSHFRAIVARLRPLRSKEAYLRLRTLPGEQGQADWGHFGRLQVGSALRPLMAFLLVLSYSRAIFLRFFLSQTLSDFLWGHEFAFKRWDGLPRVILYDNLKSVVLERAGSAIRFNRQFLAFAQHHRFEPRPVAPARGNEKGRVERAVRFVRTSFFSARRYRDLADLNRQAEDWCLGVAMQRQWTEDKRLTVREAFLREKAKLLPLPENPFPAAQRIETTAGKSPYVRFDLNDYSVPHEFASKPVVVLASLDTVRILFEGQVVARHQRSNDREKQIEDPLHVGRLAAIKREASKHRAADRLARAAPSALKLLEKIAERGQPLGHATQHLAEFLDAYGAEAVEGALEEALRNDTPHLHAVRHILERNRKLQGKPPARPLPLPDDPRVRNLTVRPHSLTDYDKIQEDTDDEDQDRSGQ